MTSIARETVHSRNNQEVYMSSSIEAEIQAKVASFVEELGALIRASALERVKNVLGGESKGSHRKNSPTRAARRTKGAKRTPKELEALTEQVARFVGQNPGRRIEQLSVALGVPTKDLSLPLKKLIAAKRAHTTDHKRSTKYFPLSRGAAKRTSRSASSQTAPKSAKSGKPRGRQPKQRAPTRNPTVAKKTPVASAAAEQ